MPVKDSVNRLVRNVSYVAGPNQKVVFLFPVILIAIATVGLSAYLLRSIDRSQAPERSSAQTAYPKPLRIIEVQFISPSGPPEISLSQLSQGARQQIYDISAFQKYKNPLATSSLLPTVVETITLNQDFPNLGNWEDNYNAFLEQSLPSGGTICNKVVSQNIDQVWIWRHPNYGGAAGEGVLSSKLFQPSWTQYLTVPITPFCGGQRGFAVMGFDYTRLTDPHSFMHMMEALIGSVQGVEMFWYRYAGDNTTGFPRAERCGNVHFPPNVPGVAEQHAAYNYTNTTVVQSSCENWKPDGTGVKTAVSCSNWGCDAVGYQRWLGMNMPNMNNSLFFNGKLLPNWWDFLVDIDNTLVFYTNSLYWMNPVLKEILPSLQGSDQTTSCSGTSGTSTTCNAGSTTYVEPEDSAVLQASTYADMILVTVTYGPSANPTAQVNSVSYCGAALQRVGNRTKYQHQAEEMWYKVNPSTASNCQTVVNFSLDPGHRVVSTTKFHNIDTVSPIVGTPISSGTDYPPGSNLFQVSSVGPKDSILICGLTTYPNWPNNFVSPELTNGRHLWGSTQLQSNLLKAALASSYQRTADNQNMTIKYTSSQSFPWAGVCANFRVKPFTSVTPPPPPPPNPPPPPPATPVPTPVPTATPAPTASPAPAGGLPFSVDLKLNNSDGPILVTPGGTVTVSWTISGGASCTASGGSFTGTKTGTGSQSVTVPSTAPYGFSLTCKGQWGFTSDSVIGYTGAGGFNTNPILKVNGSDGPVTLAAGSSVNVTWKNPPGITYTSCTASSAWTGTKAVTGGTQVVTALTAGNKIFTLACVNSGVTYTTRKFVNVEAAGSIAPNNVISGGFGLTQRFYLGRNFETLYNTQTVNQLPNFDWGSSGVIPGSPGGAGGITENYSARISAQIYPYETAEHTFTAIVDDGLRLWIGDQMLIDSFTFGGRRVLTGKINLVAGRAYPMKAEYFESAGDAVFILTVGSSFSGGGPASIYMTPADLGSRSVWNLNETSGTAAGDTGTLGVPGSVLGVPARIASCKQAGCINFDGVNDYISMGDKNDMIGNQITLSTWVNVPAHKNYNFIINKLGTAGNYRLYMNSAGKVIFGARNTANVYQEHISTASLAVNTWHHVVVTFNQATKASTIYINGVGDSSKTNYTILRGDTLQALEIGRSGAYYFKGMIDETRMYPRVLTPSEITGLYNLQNIQ